MASTASPSAAPGREIERQRHRRKLSLVVDRQIGHVLRVVLGHRRQRHHLAGQRRLQVQLVERGRVGLQRRRDLEHHVIAVGLGEELRRLPLAEGIVQRLIDGGRLNAETRRLIAVDVERQHAAAGLLVRGHIAQHGQLLQRRQQLRRPLVELVDVRILQRVLILGARGAAADVQILRRLHEQRGARHLRQLRPQAVDDLVGAGAALVARLQADDHEAVVDRAGCRRGRCRSWRHPDPWRPRRAAHAAAAPFRRTRCPAAHRTGRR